MIENKKVKTSSTGLVGLLSFLIIVMLYFFVIRSTAPQLKEARISLATNTEQENKLQEKLNSLKTIEAQLARYEGLLTKINLAMPTDEAVPETITQIEALLANAGVEVGSLQMSITGADGEMPVSFSVKGDLAQVYNMVNIIQSNIRPFTIKNLAISSDKDNVLTANFTLGLQYLKKGAAGTNTVPQERNNEDSLSGM